VEEHAKPIVIGLGQLGQPIARTVGREIVDGDNFGIDINGSNGR
jgi:hypothetical protein